MFRNFAEAKKNWHPCNKQKAFLPNGLNYEKMQTNQIINLE